MKLYLQISIKKKVIIYKLASSLKNDLVLFCFMLDKNTRKQTEGERFATMFALSLGIVRYEDVLVKCTA